MPNISIIIPAYCPLNFEALGTSIAANTDADAEWIVVDDGSGSEYDKVFATLPASVRLLRLKENRRQGGARNAGLSIASGKWIKFLDADDMLDKSHLSTLYAAACKCHNTAIPFAPTKHIFWGGGISVNTSWRDLPSESQAQFRRQLVRPFLHHCGALYPRELLVRIGGYDESLLTDEDGDLLLRILREGYYFTPVDSVNYHYMHHEGMNRVSADDDIRKMQARISVCEKVISSFAGQLTDQVAQALAQRMDKIAMSYWQSYPIEAKSLLAKAKALSPGYQPDMRMPLLLLRKFGGIRLVFFAQSLYRQLQGRPRGGAQG